MSNVKIMTDSACDAHPAWLAKENIHVIPLMVQLGQQKFQDGVDILADEIYQWVTQTGRLPRITPPTVDDFQKEFRQLKKAGNEIVYIGLSSQLSDAVENAQKAAQGMDGIYVVDSQSISCGVEYLVMEAQNLIFKHTGAEIAEMLDMMKQNLQVRFSVDNYAYLQLGGQFSTKQVLRGGFLRLRPTLIMQDGKLILGTPQKGASIVAKQAFAEQLFAEKSVQSGRICITHTGCEDLDVLDVFVQTIQALQPFNEVHISKAGGFISATCGPNTIGVAFMEKK